MTARIRVLGEGDTMNAHVRYWPTPRAFALLGKGAPDHPTYRNPNGTLRKRWERKP